MILGFRHQTVNHFNFIEENLHGGEAYLDTLIEAKAELVIIRALKQNL